MYVIKTPTGDMYVATKGEYRHDRYSKLGGRIAFRIKPKYDYILPGYRDKV